MIGNHLNIEPATLIKLMPLLFRDEFLPDAQVLFRPSIRTFLEDVVGQNIVVAKRGHHRDNQIIGGVVVLIVVGLAKDLQDLLYQQFIELNNLLSASRYLFVVVVTSRVARPHHEINRVFQLRRDPIKGRIDQRDR